MHCKKVPIGATIKYGSFIMGEGIIYKVSTQVTHRLMPQSLTNYLMNKHLHHQTSTLTPDMKKFYLYFQYRIGNVT